MDQFLFIFICLLGGYLFKKIPTLPSEPHKVLNLFILYTALPAFMLQSIPKLQLKVELIHLFLCGWLIFIFSFLFFKLLSIFIPFERKTLACLVIVCGLSNTSFIGFPLVQAYYGEEGLLKAVLVDQGTFLALASIAQVVALYYSESSSSGLSMLKKIVSAPQFIAFMLGLLLIPIGISSSVSLILGKLSAPLIPLALFSVGMQLNFELKKENNPFLLYGLLYKLAIAPILILLYCLFFSEISGLNSKVAILEAAMPPMLMGSVLASQYHLNTPLAQLLTGIGILLGFFSTWVWVFLLA